MVARTVINVSATERLRDSGSASCGGHTSHDTCICMCEMHVSPWEPSRRVCVPIAMHAAWLCMEHHRPSLQVAPTGIVDEQLREAGTVWETVTHLPITQ